jgi:uncharacterized repeat protein (TIGR03803 family)
MITIRSGKILPVLLGVSAAVGTAWAQTPTEVVLHTYVGSKGYDTLGGVIPDSAGNLYGATAYGGTADNGVVYRLNAAGYTVLYNFTGLDDGGHPYSGVILDSAGNLYGTTLNGGVDGQGVIYKVDTSGHETVLYSFPGGAEGTSPKQGVILDSAGNLYGTTLEGGTSDFGVVYKLDTTGHYTVLHSFKGGADGDYPEFGNLVMDPSGNLYGVTDTGGGDPGWGVVYKVDPSGHETVLYIFTNGADGGGPSGTLIVDGAGNIYGTAESGGTSDYGVVFKLDPSGQETVLYNFTGGADGGDPNAGVIMDAAGNLYGTTYIGGIAIGYLGDGVVYKVDPSGEETVLNTFTYANGALPSYGSLILNSAGSLFGTTFAGGQVVEGARRSGGVIFEITVQ